jgi:DNA-binding transcriptional LysR family regulator
MSASLNWDEFRVVRAIAEAQSLGGAAERLGLNHSTLFRRLAAIEAQLGVRLFERERSGYRPTVAGEDMVALASLMSDTIAEFERRVTQKEVQLSGRVRLTTVHSLALLMLGPITAELARAHPALHLEIHLAHASLDVARGEADIALRCLNERPPSQLASRRAAPLPWRIYAAPQLTTPSGEPRANARWIVPGEKFGPSRLNQWLDRHIEPWRRAATANSDIMMAELAERGVGVALLPCYVGVTRPLLRVVGDADQALDGELWLLATEHGLRTPRVRAVYDFLGEELERRRAWFEGEAVIGP